MAGVLDRVADAEEVRSERRRILAGLLAGVEELADRAVARMPREIPAYAARDPAFFADVRDQVVRHYRVKLDSLLADGVPLAVGVGTVAAGVAELPRAYREATAALADVAMAGGRTGRNPRRIADLVDLLVAIALVDGPGADA